MNKKNDNIEADLQIGPTDHGMVRFIISTEQGVLNLEFDPDEARDIAEEIRLSADRAEASKKR